MNWRPFAVATGMALVISALPLRAADSPKAGLGESIYLHGILESGAALEGKRDAEGVSTRGAQAACVNCHQRSGLGSKEGTTPIPPITGEYLFSPANQDDGVTHYVESMHGNRAPYDDVTLARAIREGIDSQGRPLSILMPRFALDDAEMTALIDYLRKMSVRHVAGVTDTTLHFATIFTPDADPVKRSGVLDVLEHYIAEKNTFPFRPSPAMRTSGKTAFSKSMYLAHRHWQLHVWDLKGPANTWQAQLDKHFEEEPVYAVLSGLGGSNWAPVQAFCESHALPCLFPNVEVPVVAGDSFYSLYFSKGVLLEAELVADRIRSAAVHPQQVMVRQVYRAGDSGEAAAAALATELKSDGFSVGNVAVPAAAQPHALAQAVSRATSAQVLVLWLRPADIAALGSITPGTANVYMSGLMGGLEDAPLPARWRSHTTMSYPFDIPDKRGVRLDYPFGWFKLRQIPVVATQVQADTYLDCTLIADTLNNHMSDVVSGAYLIEQLQGMIERRIMTGYYPHLTLAANQHFASKGGYLVRFADPTGTALSAVGDWTVPESTH